MKKRLFYKCLALTLIVPMCVPMLAMAKKPAEEPVSEEFSKELVIQAENESKLPENGTVLSGYEGTYLVGFDSAKEAKAAYEDFDGDASPNISFSVASETTGNPPEEAVAPEVFDHLEDELGSPNPKHKGYTVALIDTGVPANANVERISMFGDDGVDRNGHGEVMLATMQAIDPDIQVLSIKALNDEGYGDAATIYAAIQYAIERKVSLINLSISGRTSEENAAITSIIFDARKAGIEVVGAAGNQGMDVKDFLPGGIADVTVIGACNTNGNELSISNYGDTVDYYVSANSTSVATAAFSGHLAKNEGNQAATETGKNDPLGWLWTKDAITRANRKETTNIGDTGFYAQGIQYGDLSNIKGYAFTVDSSKMKLDSAVMWSDNPNWVKEQCKEGVMVERNFSAVYYKGEVTRGNSQVPGTVWVRFPGAVDTDTGEKCDLLCEFSNIWCYTKYSSLYGPMILRNDEGYASIFTGRTKESMEAGISMHIKYSVVRPNTTETVPGTIMLGMDDLDMPDSNGSYRGDHSTYQEGVTILSGLVGDIYVMSNTVLRIENNNLSFFGTQETEDANEESRKRGGLVFAANAEGTEVLWSGHGCGTYSVIDVNMVAKKYHITSSKEGPGSLNHGQGVEAFEGSQKTFICTPNAGARIDRIVVDGKDITVTNPKGMNYTFSDIRSNHTIHVVYAEDNQDVTTSVRWRDVNGNWTNYQRVDAKSVTYGAAYSYTWVRNVITQEPENVYENASPNPVGVSSVTENKDFYMDVERKKYTYRFDFNPPTGHNSSEIGNKQGNLENKWAESMSGDVKTPSLTGYTFLGWNTKADGTGTAYTNEKMLSNKTFYARWQANQYHVRYDGNGAFNPDHEEGEFTQNTVTSVSGMPSSTFTFDTRGMLTANDFVRDGYEFTGWNTKADGSGTNYPDKYAEVLNWASKNGQEITLYAQWRKKLGKAELMVVSEETGNPLPGTSIKLYHRVNGELTEVPGMETLVTDPDGKIMVEGLHWFNYEWQSVEVPSGYEPMKPVGFEVTHQNLSQQDEQILYMKHADLTINSEAPDIIKGENPPMFLYQIQGKDAAGVEHTYHVMVKTDPDGKGQETVSGLFAGNYEITQLPVSRYLPLPATGVSAVTVTDRSVTAKLMEDISAEVLFPYAMEQYHGFGAIIGKAARMAMD